MTRYITSILALGCLVLLFVSCDHETDGFDGPNLIDRFGDFALITDLEVNAPTVDFSAGESAFFTAKFNKNISWVVEITGMESGAVKRIEGFDSELNSSNATWLGGTTSLPFFKAEKCQAKLIVPEEPTVNDSVDVEVLMPKTYEGTLIIDYETDPGSNLEVGNYEFEFLPNTGRQNDIPAAQGDYYFLFEGEDKVVSNFFVGLTNIHAGISGETYFPVPTSIPEELYFNAFIYHDGSPHTIAVIQFVYDTNGTGTFEDGPDETFQIAGDYPLDWNGWQHISHPMSDLGITQDKLDKIVAVRVLLISNMNTQPTPPLPVRFGIDFLSFTEGKALEL